MTNQEILTKAIKKGIAGGWRGDLLGNLRVEPWSDNKGVTIVNGVGEEWSQEEIIFNHDFAKSLWGERIGKLPYDLDDPTVYTVWQYHLRQMVIADDPIKYLEENL